MPPMMPPMRGRSLLVGCRPWPTSRRWRPGSRRTSISSGRPASISQLFFDALVGIRDDRRLTTAAHRTALYRLVASESFLWYLEALRGHPVDRAKLIAEAFEINANNAAAIKRRSPGDGAAALAEAAVARRAHPRRNSCGSARSADYGRGRPNQGGRGRPHPGTRRTRIGMRKTASGDHSSSWRRAIRSSER